MKKFNNFEDCTKELKIIDDELSQAFDEEDYNLCLEKASLRAIVISQINQLRRTHKLSKKAQEKLQKSWEANQFIVDGITKKQKSIKNRLDQRKKFVRKVGKCKYEQ